MDLNISGAPSELRAFLDAAKATIHLEPAVLTSASLGEAIVSPAKSLKPTPRLVRIGEDGGTTQGNHVAVWLPDYDLMFSVETKKSKSWEDAKKIASECDICGFADWRLPTDMELQLLVRRDLHSPAIDRDAFPNTPTSDWFWTSTPHASYAGYAWMVNFLNGDVLFNNRLYGGFVRAVRRVPASQ